MFPQKQYTATFCACLFTGIGSVFAYYMARLCAPLVERFFPRALSTTRTSLLSGSSSDLFTYLLLARLFPLLPYSILNIACGVLWIPILPYFISLVLGSFPYNFVTTQLGDLLGTLAGVAAAAASADNDEYQSINAVWTWSLCFKLAVASLLSAAPILFKEQLKYFLGGTTGLSGSSLISTPSSSLSSSSSIPHQAETEKISCLKLQNSKDLPSLRNRNNLGSSLFTSDMLLRSTRSKKSGDYKNSHTKNWSWGWTNHLRTSFSCDSTSSFDSGYAIGLPSHPSHHHHRQSIDVIQDEEQGDTDEEDWRENKLSSCLPLSLPPSTAVSIAARKQRKTASIEGDLTSLGYLDLLHTSQPKISNGVQF